MARAPRDYDLPLELMVRLSEIRAAEELAAPARRVTRARGRRSVSAFSGFATFVALLVTDLISDGISIEGGRRRARHHEAGRLPVRILGERRVIVQPWRSRATARASD